MSSEELVSAYAAGRISRRTLIRRLLAAGVSLGAAASYASLLAPKARADECSSHPEPEYPCTHVRILSDRLRVVVDHKRARVRVRSAEAGKFHVYIYRAGRSGIGHEVIGRRGVEFSEAGVQDFSVPIDVESLRHRDEAWLLATVFWKDSLGNQLGLASDSKKLT